MDFRSADAGRVGPPWPEGADGAAPADPLPGNGFVPVERCWQCSAIAAVLEDAWEGQGDLSLRDWLSVTASGMHHRMSVHGVGPLSPAGSAAASDGLLPSSSFVVERGATVARVFSVSDSIVVGVSPDRAYDAVSRPADMGRWSPENLGTTGRSPNAPASLGTIFVGRNRRGRLRWTTRCTVTAADPGRRFAFRVHAIGLGRPIVPGAIATWEYRFEPAGEGTRVTETWSDDRRGWPDAVANVFDRIATSGSTFAQFQGRNIAATLRNLKRELEGERTH